MCVIFLYAYIHWGPWFIVAAKVLLKRNELLRNLKVGSKSACNSHPSTGCLHSVLCRHLALESEHSRSVPLIPLTPDLSKLSALFGWYGRTVVQHLHQEPRNEEGVFIIYRG